MNEPEHWKGQDYRIFTAKTCKGKKPPCVYCSNEQINTCSKEDKECSKFKKYARSRVSLYDYHLGRF